MYAAISIGDKVKRALESLVLLKLPVKVTGLYLAWAMGCLQLRLGEGEGLTQSAKVSEAQPQSGPVLWRIIRASTWVFDRSEGQLLKLTRL